MNDFLPNFFGKQYGGGAVRRMVFERKPNGREDVIVNFKEYMKTQEIHAIRSINYDGIKLNIAQYKARMPTKPKTENRIRIKT